MNIFRTGVKWQMLLMMATMGVLLFGGAALLPDADAAAGLEVVSTDPANGATVAAFPTSVTVTFSDNIFGGEEDAADLMVGGLPATAVERINDTTFTFTVDATANIGAGPYTVTMAPGVMGGGQEASNEEYLGSFTFAPPGSITVMKEATPRDGTDFVFSFSGPNAEHTLTLDDDDNLTEPVRADNFTISLLDAGDYEITETLPPTWQLVSIECDEAAVTTPVAGGITVSLAQGQDVTCTFVNNQPPITVCVVKMVGTTGSTLASPEDSRFDVVVDGSPLPGQLQPVTFNPSCFDGQEGGLNIGPGVGLIRAQSFASASFSVAPGSSFTITEADTTPGVGPTDILCSVSQIDASRQVDGVLDTRSVTVELDQNENENAVNCTFINDSIDICVTKQFGSGASALNASRSDFTFSLNDGDPQQLGPYCAQDEISAHFFAAPGSTATITEILSAAHPAIRPISIVCSQEVPNDAGIEVRAIGTANLGQGSISIDTSLAEQGIQVDCVFTNDALIVCVTKTLGAAAASVAMPGDFTFDLSVSGENDVLVPSSSAPLCDVGQGLSDNSGIVGVALRPGTVFSLSERDPGPTSALTSAACSVGEAQIMLADDELASRTFVDVSPPIDAGQVDCTFVNDSVLVCLAKQISKNADEAGIANADGFTFDVTAGGSLLLDDQALEPDNTECPQRVGAFNFAIAPNTALTFTENIPVASPLRPTAFSCEALTLSNTDEGDTTVDLATTLSGSVGTVTTPAPGAQVRCYMTNDVRVVCVTKALGDGAVTLGYSPNDFDFTVTYDGTVGSSAPDGFCGESSGANAVTRGVLIAPGSTTVKVQENGIVGNGAPVGLESASCRNGDESIVADIDDQSVTFTDVGDPVVDCFFKNDTLILCVAKIVGPTGLAGGFTPADFAFTVEDNGTTIESFSTECGPNGEAIASYAYALAPDELGTVTITETSTPADASIGLVSAQCQPGLNVSTTDLAARSVVSPKQHGGDSVLKCAFVNDSVAVTLTKSVVNDDGGIATANDFVFDVFDQNGAAIKSDLRTGAVVYVAPDVPFTVSERAAAGYTATGTCADVTEQVAGQALAAAASVTHAPATSVKQVECTFVNDDIPRVPVCAMLTFEEGDSSFTLADFTLELFQDGAIIGQRTADEAFDAVCEDTTDNSADLLPGNLVLLAQVFPDSSPLTFVVSVADPTGLIEFEPLTCDTGTADAVQALSGPDPVTFSPAGAPRVLCAGQAKVKPKPPVTTNTNTGVGTLRPTFIADEPAVTVAAAAPVAAAASIQVVSAPIAVTGSSTTDVTVPIGLSLLAFGFLGLGLDRTRRRRLNQG